MALVLENVQRQSVADVRELDGDLIVAITRNGKVLRNTLIPARKLAGVHLRLLARREGDLLTFQIGTEWKLEVYDYFPIGSDEQGNFGVIWPHNVGLRWLLASRQVLPDFDP